MLGLLKARSARVGVTGGLVAFLNPYSYLLMRKERHVLERFDTIHCDGFMLAWLLRSIGVRSERVSFDATSLAPRVFSDSTARSSRVYLVGSEPGAIDSASATILKQYRGLNLIGIRHGFFASPAERHEFVHELAVLNPDVVVAGMGTPLQERFLADLRIAGWKGSGYTCGGFFHQTAKRGVNYYPQWIDRLNLRFLYRMWDEPKLIRRYLIEYPKFFGVFAFDLLLFIKQRFFGESALPERPRR